MHYGICENCLLRTAKVQWQCHLVSFMPGSNFFRIWWFSMITVNFCISDRDSKGPLSNTIPEPQSGQGHIQRGQRGLSSLSQKSSPPWGPPKWNDTLNRGLWRATIESWSAFSPHPLAALHFEKSGYAFTKFLTFIFFLMIEVAKRTPHFMPICHHRWGIAPHVLF